MATTLKLKIHVQDIAVNRKDFVNYRFVWDKRFRNNTQVWKKELKYPKTFVWKGPVNTPWLLLKVTNPV